ncbi:hypothetical protein [Flavobacterium sp.]|uniref:hypothetical protein n=1 Tax=Flavobacterium sp. TaxID=239 RepID=UPI0037527784
MSVTNVISLATAQKWAETWRANPDHVVKAFLIPEVDITELMAEADVQDARAYLGIDETGAHKLMLVGVDKNGKDLIDYENGLYIYDYTTTCPPDCDVSSPMYRL